MSIPGTRDFHHGLLGIDGMVPSDSEILQHCTTLHDAQARVVQI